TFEVVVCLEVVGPLCDAAEVEHDVPRVLEPLKLEGAKVEQPILRERAAGRTAELLLRRRCCLAERILLGQIAMPIDVEAGAMARVAARLRDGVDQAAGRASELSGVARRDNLKLFDGLLRDGERIVRSLAADDPAKERLVVIGAVDADVRVDAA